MLILPFRAEAIGNVLDDLPVWPAAFQRFEHLVEPLDAPFRAREGALFFKTWTGGQHHLGKLACRAPEGVLPPPKLPLLEAIADELFLRAHDTQLFAQQ